MIELVLIVGAALTALVLVNHYPQKTRLWFDRILSARRVVFATIGLITAIVFIGTGSPFLMLLGFIGFVYVALYLIFEEPHQEVIRWIGR